MRRLALGFLVLCVVFSFSVQVRAVRAPRDAGPGQPEIGEVEYYFEKSDGGRLQSPVDVRIGWDLDIRFYMRVGPGEPPRNITCEGKWQLVPDPGSEGFAAIEVLRGREAVKVKVHRKGSGTIIFEKDGQVLGQLIVRGTERRGAEAEDWRDGPLGRMIGDLLCWIAEIIYGFPGFQTPDVLVFGRGGPKVAGVFTEREWEAISRWYRLFAGVGLSGYMVYLALLLHGLRALAGSSNPVQRASLMEALTDTLVAMCIAVFGLAGLRAMLEVNQALVNAICTWMGPDGQAWVQQFNQEMLKDLIVPHSRFWTGVVRVVYAFTCIALNFLYLVRKFVLAVSTVLLPVMGWAWAFKGTRLPVLLLGTEMVTNSLMSFSHALVLALLWDLFYRSGPSPSAGGIPGDLLGVLSRGVNILVAVSGLAALLAVTVAGYRILIAVTAQDRAQAFERLRSALVASGFLFGAWVIMRVLLEVVVR